MLSKNVVMDEISRRQLENVVLRLIPNVYREKDQMPLIVLEEFSSQHYQVFHRLEEMR
jgi:hypothetical protein